MRKNIKQLFDLCPDLPTYTIKVYNSKQHRERPAICNPEDAKRIARRCFDEGLINLHEHAFVIALNRRRKVIGIYPLSKGGLTGTVCDPRSIFQFAILAGATSIFLHITTRAEISSRADRTKNLHKRFARQVCYLILK